MSQFYETCCMVGFHRLDREQYKSDFFSPKSLTFLHVCAACSDISTTHTVPIHLDRISWTHSTLILGYVLLVSVELRPWRLPAPLPSHWYRNLNRLFNVVVWLRQSIVQQPFSIVILCVHKVVTHFF